MSSRIRQYCVATGLVLSSVLTGRALPNDLQTYAQQCSAAIGVDVPDFDCDAGTEVPAQGSAPYHWPATTQCDQPNRLNRVCDPGSKFQVLHNDPKAIVVAHCRKRGGGTGLYGDIAVIQYSRVNGATCFYQALGHNQPAAPGDMVGGSSAPGATPKPAFAPSKGLASGFPWLSPSETAGIGCANCHDNGPLIRSPYINGVKDANKLPGSDDFAFNRDQPYAFVGDPFSHWKAYKVEVAGNLCISCHRLGVNNVGGGGTARDFAIRATTLQEVAKNPPDPSRPNASPIWMPPAPPQLAVDPHNQTSAQAIKDCAESGALIVVTSDDPAAITPPGAPVKVAAGNYTAVFPIVDVYAGKPKWVKFVATYSGAVAAGQTWTPAAPDQTCPRRRVCPRGSWWDDQECACLRGPPQ